MRHHQTAQYHRLREAHLMAERKRAEAEAAEAQREAKRARLALYASGVVLVSGLVAWVGVFSGGVQ